MLETVFLQNILEQPDDEVARLAYADWLLESGDPANADRGEFIQIQCQFARLSAGSLGEWADADRLPELKAREQELLDQYADAWRAPVWQIAGPCVVEFRRGFVEEVDLSTEVFPQRAPWLFEAAPIRSVRFISGNPRDLLDCKYLARLTGIDLSYRSLDDAALRTLLSSKYLTALTTLDLNHNRLTDFSARALADSAYLAQLTTLNLGNNYLTMNGVRALFNSPHWGSLRNLMLTGNDRITAREMAFLGQSLQGNPDPKLLRTLLQMASRQEYDYSNAPVRELAKRAGSEPRQAVNVLGEGLRGSHRKVRAAAARMLGQLGAQATSGVPLLVQRLFEHNPVVRDHVAPALARLLPHLPEQAQAWLCRLANPLLTPLANLRVALNDPRLPGKVREEFALVCARRSSWRRHISAGKSGPAPVPEPATVARSPAEVVAALNDLTTLVERHAARGLTGPKLQEARDKARDKECAWLLARLCELLLATLPAPEPKLARKVRR
jgi:uncharacterized protein (TIGR02996 family)